MTYVIIHGRGLAGLGAGPDENALREVLYARASVAIHEMANKITSILNASFSPSSMAAGALASAVPGIGLVVLPAFMNATQARAFLVKARDDLVKVGGSTLTVLEALGNVARDKSISYSEAVNRIDSFLRDFARNIDAQIKINKSSAGIFDNTLQAFRDAAKQVGKEVVPADEDVPMWAWGIGGIAALVLISNIVNKAGR